MSQIVGLTLVNESIKTIEFNVTTNTTTIAHETTAIGDRPDFQGYQSLLYLMGGVFIGTILLLLLIKFKQPRIWKLWFFLAIWLSVSVSLGVLMNRNLAILLAIVLAILKLYKPNPWIHNTAEILMYAGIAILLVPIFNPLWAFIMLIIISIYDAIAVWQSKHMIKLAKFQTKNKVFAGLMLPKKEEAIDKNKIENKFENKTKNETKNNKTNTNKILKTPPKPGKTKTRKGSAILGGGDVAFPLIFSGVIMESLIMQGLSKAVALSYSLIIVATTTMALTLLFLYSKKNKFYPAMPFLSAGCFIGWGIIMLLV